MARLLAISSFVLLALGLVILAYLASLTKDDGLNAMNQQINRLIEQEKYQEAIPNCGKSGCSGKARSGFGTARDRRHPE